MVSIPTLSKVVLNLKLLPTMLVCMQLFEHFGVDTAIGYNEEKDMQRRGGAHR